MGVMWVFRMEGGAFRRMLPASVHAPHEDLHERALARTVLPNQGVNFAGPDRKLTPLRACVAPKRLRTPCMARRTGGDPPMAEGVNSEGCMASSDDEAFG